jgi:5'-deoxynucleotidase YfbR-like HD superfamily hydrolase
MYKEKFINIIDVYGLGEYLGYFISNNSGNLNPYHNLYHAQCVVENCLHISKAYNDEISALDVQTLLLAALFHDFKHSTLKDTESDNIEVAIDGLRQCCVYLNDDFDVRYESLIRSTFWPYTKKGDELTLMEKILRDADKLQCFESNYIQQTFMGLNKEWGGDLIQSIDTQMNYIKNLELDTLPARTIWMYEHEDKIRELEYLKAILIDA